MPPTLLQPQSTDLDVKVAGRISALEARIAALETGTPVPIGTGTPDPATGRDGSFAGDTDLRLWLKIDGVWRYTNLT